MDENFPIWPNWRGLDEIAACRGGGVTQAADSRSNDYFDERCSDNNDVEPYGGDGTDLCFREGLDCTKKNRDRPVSSPILRGGLFG